MSGNTAVDDAALALAVLDSLKARVAQLDQTGTILAVNQAWREEVPAFCGRTLLRRPLEGANYLRVCARSARAGDAVAAQLEDGLRQVLERHVEGFTCEYSCPQPEGMSWFLLWAAPVLGPEEGAVIAHFDITSRKVSEEHHAQLRQAIEVAALEWAQTFDAIRSPVLVIQPGGAIARVNEAARELVGKGFPEIIGRTLEEIGQGEPWREAAALVRGLAAGGGPDALEVHDAESGRHWHVKVSLRPSARPDRERIILQLHDVTPTVRLQESLRRSEVMATLGAVVAGLAHEVRNPLFGMSAVLEAFESRFGERSEYKEYLGCLRAELVRIQDLMQSLLTYGRPEVPSRESVSPTAAIEEAVGLCQKVARGRQVTLVTDLAEHLPMLVADRKRLVLALKNVIENGVQMSKAGGSVRILGRSIECDGALWLRLAVEDSGPGFAAADLSRVFQPFVTHRQGGTGLGLAIAAQVIEGHGGTVRAHNRGAGGSGSAGSTGGTGGTGGGIVEMLLPAPAGEMP
ncbi:MAG TPA: ATP-binding protein [Thermoanaerobaculia bacterium]|nr:ATP-binding protein [Thermoanaerobaculia bacterium]